MIKDFQLLSRAGTPRRKTGPILDAAQYFGKLRDDHWEKYIGMETYQDPERTILVDYDFWLDLDAEGKSDRLPIKNIALTLPGLRRLVEYLHSKMSLPVEDLQIYFSGQGGFHILLPFKLEKPVEADILLAAAKQVVVSIVAGLAENWPKGIKLDLQSRYSRHQVMRLPWSLHQSGLRKVPLSGEDLNKSPEALLKLIECKSQGFRLPYDLNWLTGKRRSKLLGELVAVEVVRHQTMVPTEDVSLYQTALQNVKNEAPCMLEICNFQAAAQRLPFNKVKMFLLSQWKRFGISQEIAVSYVQTFANGYSKRKHSTPTKARNRRNEVESSANSIFSPEASEKYNFIEPGFCYGYLKSAIYPASSLLPCVQYQCPHAALGPKYHPMSRLRLEQLLKRGLDPVELRVFLELAVIGDAESQQELTERVGLSINTVHDAIEALKSKGLVLVSSEGKKRKIRARFGVVKSLDVKN